MDAVAERERKALAAFDADGISRSDGTVRAERVYEVPWNRLSVQSDKTPRQYQDGNDENDHEIAVLIMIKSKMMGLVLLRVFGVTWMILIPEAGSARGYSSCEGQ